MREPEQYLGLPVRSLQTMLRTIAKNGARIPPVIPDGIFGANTEAALKAFQRLNGLPATGRTDQLTWEALNRSFSHASIYSGPAAVLQIILQPNQVLRPGEANDHLHLIQAMLHVLSTYYHDVPAVAMTGVLDAQTQNAVRWLRKAAALPDSPQIDRLFWLYLTHLYRAAAQDGTRQPVFE